MVNKGLDEKQIERIKSTVRSMGKSCEQIQDALGCYNSLKSKGIVAHEGFRRAFSAARSAQLHLAGITIGLECSHGQD